jgi:hypothetical protein
VEGCIRRVGFTRRPKPTQGQFFSHRGRRQLPATGAAISRRT